MVLDGLYKRKMKINDIKINEDINTHLTHLEDLSLFNGKIDTLKNLRDLLKKPYIEDMRSRWSPDKTFTLKVITVTDSHIIAKVVNKDAPFIFPKIHDTAHMIVD